MFIEHEKEYLADKLRAIKIDTIDILANVKKAKFDIKELNKSILDNLYEISREKLLKPVDTKKVRVLFKKVMKQSIKMNELYESSRLIAVDYNNQLKRIKLIYEELEIPICKLELPEITPPTNKIDNVLSGICYALDSGLNDLTIEMIDTRVT